MQKRSNKIFWFYLQLNFSLSPLTFLLIIQSMNLVTFQNLSPPIECPVPKFKMQGLDSSQFIGTWYIVSSYYDKTLLDVRCEVMIFSWPSTSNNNSELSLFKKFVSFGKEKKYLGSAINVAPGVLGINYPGLRECTILFFWK